MRRFLQRQGEKISGQWAIIWLGQFLWLSCLMMKHSSFWGLLFAVWVVRIVVCRHRQWLFIAGGLLVLSTMTWGIQERHYHILEMTYAQQSPRELLVTVDPNDVTWKEERGYAKARLAQGKVLLTHLNAEKMPYLQANDQLLALVVTGQWERFSGSENFDSFNAQSYEKSRGVLGAFQVDRVKNIERLTGVRSLWPSIRRRFLNYIDHLPSPTLALLFQSFLLNEKGNLPTELRSSFQRLGLMPFLALSGFHVQVLVDQLSRFFYRLGLTRRTTAGLVMTFLMTYGALVSWPVSMVRAVGMYGLSLLPLKEVTRFDRLAWMGMGVLCYDPFQRLSLSYLLSFALTAILILLAENWQGKGPSVWPISWISGGVLCSLTLWLTSQFFFRVNGLVTLWSALFSFAFTYVLLPLLAFGGLYGLLPRPLWGIYRLVDYWLNYFLLGLQGLAKLPIGYWVIGKLPQWVNGLYLIVCLIALKHWRQQRIRWGSVLGFMLINLMLLNYNHWSLQASMIMVNVHQGDAFLAYTPGKRHSLLIDTGGVLAYSSQPGAGKKKHTYEAANEAHAERFLLPALYREGISRLSVLILTHPDADHIGGAIPLMDRLSIGEIWLSKGSEGDKGYRAILQKAAEKDIPVRLVATGYQHSFGPLALRILSPDHVYAEKNDQSVVTQLTYNGLRLLTTGDASTSVEADLLKNELLIPVDILKVGHHGSKTSTSSTFLDALKPRQAFISVGQKNRYGHPNQEVLTRLKEAGCLIHQTAQEGAVRLDWYGKIGPIQRSSQEAEERKSTSED